MRKFLVASFLVLVFLGLIGGGAIYYLAFSPNTMDYEGERGVQIPRGASYAAALDSLQAGGILSDRRSLEWFGQLTGWQHQIKAGYYSIPSGASNHAMLDRIRKGLQSPVRVSIPPGSRKEVIAAVAAREMNFSREDFLQALNDDSLAAELGTDTTHLFGYMLPDTYQFYWLTSAERVVRTIKEGFDRLMTPEMREESERLNLSMDGVVTLASIVEWETDYVEERPRIAGVYLNRLRINMPLQADPTVQYAILEDEGQRRRLFYRDYEIDHPYNTYRIPGLPPGPLTNPSRSSIEAILNSDEHEYLYFVATGDGDHVFSQTLREHNQAAREYHRRMQLRREEAARERENQD